MGGHFVRSGGGDFFVLSLLAHGHQENAPDYRGNVHICPADSFFDGGHNCRAGQFHVVESIRIGARLYRRIYGDHVASLRGQIRRRFL